MSTGDWLKAFVLLWLANHVAKGRRVLSSDWGAGWDWHWPVPDIWKLSVPIFPATITSGFRPADRTNHFGVDIMYAASVPANVPASVPEFSPDGTRNKQGRYFAPPGMPVLAARAGTVWATGRTAHGIHVVLDHGKPWATFYQHLADTPLEAHLNGRNLRTGQVTAVQMGEELGHAGGSSLDAARLRHLHFAAWYKGSGDSASVDPEVEMRGWVRSGWQLP